MFIHWSQSPAATPAFTSTEELAHTVECSLLLLSIKISPDNCTGIPPLNSLQLKFFFCGAQLYSMRISGLLLELIAENQNGKITPPSGLLELLLQPFDSANSLPMIVFQKHVFSIQQEQIHREVRNRHCRSGKQFLAVRLRGPIARSGCRGCSCEILLVLFP